MSTPSTPPSAKATITRQQDRIRAGDLRALDRVDRSAVRPLDRRRPKPRSAIRPSAASICSTARPIARPVTAAGRSPTPRSTTSAVARGDDLGRGRLFPTSVKLRYAFKTPTLRDVARRAPYMHDGSVPTLDAVIDLYDRGGIERPSRAEEIKPLGLTAGREGRSDRLPADAHRHARAGVAAAAAALKSSVQSLIL